MWGQDKIVLVKKASEVNASPKDLFQFFSDLKHEGFWYAMTDQHFWPWLKEICYTALGYSDILIIVAMLLTVATMAGSNRSRKYLWYTFLIYVVSKGLMLHLA